MILTSYNSDNGEQTRREIQSEPDLTRIGHESIKTTVKPGYIKYALNYQDFMELMRHRRNLEAIDRILSRIREVDANYYRIMTDQFFTNTPDQ